MRVLVAVGKEVGLAVGGARVRVGFDIASAPQLDKTKHITIEMTKYLR
jgi:hypothetical protein